MIRRYAFSDLGGANHGWLDAKHHFSFADYYDPQKLSHGELMVINDDRIAPHTGFDTHPHRDMEIITYVRRGAISHQDDKGNKGRTAAGSIQVMSAGTGIFHSEYNLEDEETSLYQIWIKPARNGVSPRWETAEFPKTPVADKLHLVVSGDGHAPLQIEQHARIFLGYLNKDIKIKHSIEGKAYLLISEGNIKVDDLLVHKGDGVAISHEKSVNITAVSDAEVLVIEVPGRQEAR
tara:strand:- start:494 stop:1198 length:705 start_codon:yes stop_codon:yes gene_type:complete